MITNEQRAHDLAICVLNRMDLKDNDIDATPIDFYHKYVETYRTLLHQFEQSN